MDIRNCIYKYQNYPTLTLHYKLVSLYLNYYLTREFLHKLVIIYFAENCRHKEAWFTFINSWFKCHEIFFFTFQRSCNYFFTKSKMLCILFGYLGHHHHHWSTSSPWQYHIRFLSSQCGSHICSHCLHSDDNYHGRCTSLDIHLKQKSTLRDHINQRLTVPE